MKEKFPKICGLYVNIWQISEGKHTWNTSVYRFCDISKIDERKDNTNNLYYRQHLQETNVNHTYFFTGWITGSLCSNERFVQSNWNKVNWEQYKSYQLTRFSWIEGNRCNVLFWIDHSNRIWYVYGQFMSYLSPRKNEGSAPDFLHLSVSNRKNLLYNNFWYADNRKVHTGKQWV